MFPSDGLNELILTYANQIFNVAEPVQDKNDNYSEERLVDEVSIMTKVVTKMLEENNETRDLADWAHQKVKN